MDNWRVRGTKIYFPGACEEYAIRIQPYQHADSIHDPSATGGERGGHVHIWLAVGCISIAVLTYIAFSLGIFPGARTLVFAIVLGFLLLPIVFLDPVHGLMAFAIIAPLSPDFNFANNVRAQDPLVAIIILGVLFRMARHSGPRVPMPLKNTLLLYLLWGLICTPVGFISGAFPNDYPNFFYLAKHAELIFLSFAVALSVHSNKQLWMIMSAMLVGLILQQFQFQFEFLDVPKDQRYQGGAIDEGANVLAMYFTTALGVALGVVDRMRNRILAAILALMICVSSMVFFKAMSRTGYASAMLLILLATVVMRRKAVPLLLLLGSVVVFAMNESLQIRLFSIGTVVGISDDSSYSARVDAYGIIWDYITASAQGTIFGGGRGIHPLSFADTQWGIELLYGGIPGLVIFVMFVITTLVLAGKVWLACRKRFDAMGAASVACILGLSAASVSCFGLTSWSAIRTGEAIFLLVGLLMAVQRMLWIEQGGAGQQLSLSTTRSLYIPGSGKKVSTT